MYIFSFKMVFKFKVQYKFVFDLKERGMRRMWCLKSSTNKAHLIVIFYFHAILSFCFCHAKHIWWSRFEKSRTNIYEFVSMQQMFYDGYLGFKNHCHCVAIELKESRSNRTQTIDNISQQINEDKEENRREKKWNRQKKTTYPFELMHTSHCWHGPF